MVSFLKALFGGGGAKTPAAEPVEEAVEYKGFRIRPAPYKAEGQYQTAGVIEKDGPEGVKTHSFVRADRHAAREDAVAFSLSKGRQIIDEQGNYLFD